MNLNSNYCFVAGFKKSASDLNFLKRSNWLPGAKVDL